MADYPATYYNPRAKENWPDVVFDSNKKAIIFKEDFDSLENEIKAIEQELGLYLKGSYSNLKERIEAIEDDIAQCLTQAFTDRGDPNADDWGQATLTADGTWRDLDCSSIVPSGAKAIVFKTYIKYAAANKILYMRKNGNVNAYAYNWILTQVANQGIASTFTVPCDTNRVVEYSASTSPTTIALTILGWIF